MYILYFISVFIAHAISLSWNHYSVISSKLLAFNPSALTFLCVCFCNSQAVLAQNQRQLIINAAAIKRQHFHRLFHLHSPHTHTHTHTRGRTARCIDLEKFSSASCVFCACGLCCNFDAATSWEAKKFSHRIRTKGKRKAKTEAETETEAAVGAGVGVGTKATQFVVQLNYSACQKKAPAHPLCIPPFLSLSLFRTPAVFFLLSVCVCRPGAENIT